MKDNTFPGIVQFNDYVQIYEPALSHEDIMAIAEEFVRTHPKEIIIFASAKKAPADFVGKSHSLGNVFF